MARGFMVDQAAGIVRSGVFGEEILCRLRNCVFILTTGNTAQFADGDRIQFRATDGRVKFGIVLRLNKKTAGVRTDDGQN